MKLAGSLPVIPTPFFRGKIDFDSLLKLFDHLFPDLDGFTLGGSTGEGTSLSMDERRELMTFVARNAPPGKALVVGLTHTVLEELVRLAHHAEELGFAAGLVACPYYFPNSFPMVRRFFQVLGRAVKLDLVLYDNPLYTKTWLRADEILALFDSCDRFRAVKMTDHDLDKIAALKRAREVAVFSGDDVVAFRSLLLGVDGSMIIAPSVFPAAYQAVVRTLHQGDARAALQLFAAEILPFLHLFGMGDEVATTKALFKHLGIFRSDEVRPPLLPCSPERAQEVILSYEVCQAAAGERPRA